MKKLRMIVTSVVVLTIVGSAFAFSAKKIATFCVDTFPFNGTCNGTIADRYITTQNGTAFKYFPAWNGLSSQCAGSDICTTDVLLRVN